MLIRRLTTALPSLGTRLVTLVVTGAVLLSPLVGVPPVARAQTLPANCTQAGATVTCVFSYTGAEQTFLVPANAANLQAIAIGAAGGSYGFIGGQGAQVSAA